METTDKAFYEETRQQRDHNLAMAREQRELAEDRRGFLQRVFAGIAVVVVLLGIVGAITYGVLEAKKSDVKINQEHESTAKSCIERGFVWINDNCIPQQR